MYQVFIIDVFFSDRRIVRTFASARAANAYCNRMNKAGEDLHMFRKI